MPSYKILNKQLFTSGDFSLIPIRFEDRLDIMKWRNEQIYHLRQPKPLTETDQNVYFEKIVNNLFDQEQRNQILFSFLKGDTCIGYGGLVHINWVDKNAEISFIMDTSLEEKNFSLFWSEYLKIIEKIAFEELHFHKIFTYAFDLRSYLYDTLENSNFIKEAELKEHCFYNGEFKSVIIHSKINNLKLRLATEKDMQITFNWANSRLIRAHSFSKEEILFDDHCVWFLGKLKNSNCIFLILEDKGKPVGSIRFDIIQSEAIISYLVDPNLHGKGFGKIILSKAIVYIREKSSEIQTIIGKVKTENIASIKIFQNLGFKEETEENSIYKFYKNIRS